jgi:PAS domain S-box-containing protein
VINLLKKVFQDTGISLNVLQVLVTNTYDSILITDATKDAKIIYANKAFKKLTGYDPSEVMGKSPRILQGAATDRKVIARLTDSLKRGGRFEGKAVNYKKNGTPFIMHWRVLPVKVGNQVKFWVAIQRDGFVI